MGIAANSLRTYIFRIASGVIGFLIGILIARYLGPEGKGYYQGIFLFYNAYIAVIGTIGGAVIYQVTRMGREPKTVFITATAYNLAIGLVSVGVFSIYTLLVPRFQPGIAIWLVVAAIPFVLALSNLNSLFQGLNRIKTLNWTGVGSGLLQIALLGVGLAGYHINVQTAVAIWFTGQIFAVAISLWIGREYWFPPSIKDFSRPLLGSMMGFGWQISVNSIISIFNTYIDQILVLFLLHTEKYGLYSVAINGSNILQYASGAIAVAISARVGTATRDQAGKLTARAVRHTLLINTPLAVLMWSAAFMIPILYDKRYTASMVPFRILLPGILAYSVAGVFSAYFTNQLGKPKIPLMVAFISAMIDFIGSLILIPRIGMIGGAWANTLSYLISFGILVAIFCKCSGIALAKLFSVTKDDIADYKLLARNIWQFFSRKFRYNG